VSIYLADFHERDGRMNSKPLNDEVRPFNLSTGVGEQKEFCEPILGASPIMKRIFDAMKMLSETSATILITGESGTGKELIARTIHEQGSGGLRPFIAVNCGALPANLVESELFGHEKGAFTGALVKKIGKVELANGGTLFLDEIATTPFDVQIKLLRFLQERTITRVGGNSVIRLNMRVIAATNVDLKEAIRRGEFREDLYYRLNVVPIEVPPLRDRGDDIIKLTKYFLHKYSLQYSKRIRHISSEALLTLCDYKWPGNVRELKNLIERIVVLSTCEGPIRKEDLPMEILSCTTTCKGGNVSKCLNEAVRSFERRFIISILEETGWNKSEASRMMEIHRNTLQKKMRDLKIR
jgi:transcriptional regulator with PAS, ATPase and Fis domain